MLMSGNERNVRIFYCGVGVSWSDDRAPKKYAAVVQAWSCRYLFLNDSERAREIIRLCLSEYER